MHAMQLRRAGEPLQSVELPIPQPGPEEILIRVEACGVCRTDLHILDGDLGEPKLPLVLGHQIVGRVEKTGERVTDFSRGMRVGVPWLGETCGTCRFCTNGRENLCDSAHFTGYQIDGGFAEYTLANQRFSFPLSETYSSLEAAPLLCAGLIGYRSLRMTADSERIGMYGFGSSAHILLQIARFQGRKVYAFTRPGDMRGQQFARDLGAQWAGDSTTMPPETLDAAIIFAPVGNLVPQALKAVGKGGTVVCGGIHMSDIPSFPYSILWEERVLRSVANLTRRDAEELLRIAPQVPVHTQVTSFPLNEANVAIEAIRCGKVEGSVVLAIYAESTDREQ